MYAAAIRLSLSTALVVLALLVARELRVVPPALAAAPASAIPPASVAVPAEAVSIPALMVRSREVRVGDPAPAATSWLARSAVLKASAEDRGALGRRQIRAYQLDDARVMVVLEPFEPQGALRVAAIYLR